jgi:hypothetical protein
MFNYDVSVFNWHQISARLRQKNKISPYFSFYFDLLNCGKKFRGVRSEILLRQRSIIIVALYVYKRFVKKHEAFQLYCEFWLEWCFSSNTCWFLIFFIGTTRQIIGFIKEEKDYCNDRSEFDYTKSMLTVNRCSRFIFRSNDYTWVHKLKNFFGDDRSIYFWKTNQRERWAKRQGVGPKKKKKKRQ